MWQEPGQDHSFQGNRDPILGRDRIIRYRSLAEVLIAGTKYQEAIAAARRSLELSGTRPSFDVALLVKAYVMAGRSPDRSLRACSSRTQRTTVDSWS